VDKYSTGFQITITITTSDQQINLHTISTLHTSHTKHKTHIAIMGNGAKAASKRERNAKDAGSVAKSQLKSVRFFSLLIALLRKCAALASFPPPEEGKRI
jgi:hypothetical protein